MNWQDNTSYHIFAVIGQMLLCLLCWHCVDERLLFQTHTRISWLHRQVQLWQHVAQYLNMHCTMHVHSSPIFVYETWNRNTGCSIPPAHYTHNAHDSWAQRPESETWAVII